MSANYTLGHCDTCGAETRDGIGAIYRCRACIDRMVPKPTTTGAFVPLAILQDVRHALVCSDAPKHLTDKLAALIWEAESTK